MRSALFDRAFPPTDGRSDLDAAHRLSDALRNGGWLEPFTIEGVPFEPGELAFADLHVSGWRHYALDQVAYERRTILFGGPFVMALTGIASALGNTRSRQAAERAAAPRWRPLGLLRIVVTSQRLLVWFEQAWWSVWTSAITEMRLDTASRCLDLYFAADPPYRLVGCQIPALAVMLAHEIRDESFGLL